MNQKLLKIIKVNVSNFLFWRNLKNEGARAQNLFFGCNIIKITVWINTNFVEKSPINVLVIMAHYI